MDDFRVDSLVWGIILVFAETYLYYPIDRNRSGWLSIGKCIMCLFICIIHI